MLARAARHYRLVLALVRAEGTSAVWLPAALRAQYPAAELVRVEHYTDAEASLVLRWQGADGQIAEGTTITPALGSMQLALEALPVGTVVSVEEVAGESGGAMRAAKLLGACAILGVTWYLSSRIKNHVTAG